MAITTESYRSLFLQMSAKGIDLASGSGFICFGPTGPLLITNRHNVTGRDQRTGDILSRYSEVPDAISIRHNRSGRPGQVVVKDEALFDDQGEPRWVEHPELKAKADFVALPLTNVADVDFYTYDPSEPGGQGMTIGPTSVVSVLGFPFGISGGSSLPVWATGFVASEPDADFDDLPTFLIDCRTRKGLSGSPVIAYRYGSADYEGGGIIAFDKPVTRFLGIYAGRVNPDADLGIVWKATAIADLVNSIT
ncbi:serine protease [Rhizobium leguminosarum bv. viciae]|uniref:Serine protease n=1 Tax=Rhizobium leguminosarum bv. viciae TaxID=387 RepID=A0A8I2KF97_RHILV|nr:trypsin-like peptidase domain-containing protein [Rhizobium leguminosarum]MBY5792979.1 trypsin-like peptidase domain-containing protein [Rhizobium leguminosarum]NKL98633.1 serine protease [Rhizobium leguminosarum bv. viciae]NKM44219.1 serine protease [Rhizobium leguminosarum bv. viciae]